LKHALEEEEKVPLSEVINFNEVILLTFTAEFYECNSVL